MLTFLLPRITLPRPSPVHLDVARQITDLSALLASSSESRGTQSKTALSPCTTGAGCARHPAKAVRRSTLFSLMKVYSCGSRTSGTAGSRSPSDVISLVSFAV